MTGRAAATLLVLLGPGVTWAAEGRIPIPFEDPVVFPITITDGGSYILTRNLETTGVVLRITASDPVVVDLNGMRVRGLDGSADVIAVSGPDVTLRNGKVLGGANGISSTTGSLTVHGVTVSGATGIGISSTGAALTAEGATVTDTGGHGIAFRNGAVRQCRAARIGGSGVTVDGRGVQGYATIESNIVDSVGIAGISMVENRGAGDISGGRIAGNAVSRFGLSCGPLGSGQGIVLQRFVNAVVERNVVTNIGCATPADCIAVLDVVNIAIEHNQLSGPNASIGIDMLTVNGGRVVGNQIKGMASYGIWQRSAPSTGVVLSDNSITDCADWGILLEAGIAGTAVRGNLLTRNSGAVCPGPARGANLCDAATNTRFFGDNFADDVPGLW